MVGRAILPAAGFQPAGPARMRVRSLYRLPHIATLRAPAAEIARSQFFHMHGADQSLCFGLFRPETFGPCPAVIWREIDKWKRPSAARPPTPQRQPTDSLQRLPRKAI